MRDLGLIQIESVKRLPADDEAPRSPIDPDFDLNDDQVAALRAVRGEIDEDAFSVSLLYGVAGSGKTEVYIRAMRHALSLGKQAILLVPEIVLTTQLVDRLASRFERVSVLHSGMTPAQRSRAWHAIESGRTPVVIGTRSAVFAPCPNLGLICVDEEQEPSFKNLQSPRFHVRDVAIMRAQLLGASVLLGSATPAVESWHLSGSHESWRRLLLPRRVRELPMPKITVVDMQDERAEHPVARGALANDARGHRGVPVARRAGDSSDEPPRIRQPHRVPQVPRARHLPELQRRDGRPRRARSRAVPSLPGGDPGTDPLRDAGLRCQAHLSRAGHAARGAVAFRTGAEGSHRPRRQRHDDAA